MKGNKDLVFDYGFSHPFLGKPNKEFMEAENMKIKVEESIKLEDGKHDGEIEDVEYRDDPYKYTDIVIKTKQDGKDVKVKVGYPTSITENSALGKCLERFGAKLEIGKDLEPEEFLTKGKEVIFQTITEKKDKGEFYRVMPETLKPKD